MAVALKQQQQDLNEKRKRFDEDKRLFDEEHQRYMKELEDSMRFAPLYVGGGGGGGGVEVVCINKFPPCLSNGWGKGVEFSTHVHQFSFSYRAKDNKKHKRK